MFTIAIANQKGGAGKTTTASALCVGLALRGYRVLAVDLDSQRNLSTCSGVPTKGVPSVYHLLLSRDENDDEPITFDDVVQRSPRGFDVLPASKLLSTVDSTFTAPGKEYRLREALAPIRSRYDYCIIDTPPQLGLAVIWACVAATHIIMPATASKFDLEGLVQLHANLTSIRRYFNPELITLGVVLTKFNARSVISREIRQTLVDRICPALDTALFDTFIRSATTVMEAQAQSGGGDVLIYAPASNAAKDYFAFIDEVLARLGQ